jgi:protein-S-isoprenylcysteine O-methyltransferase Ste14
MNGKLIIAACWLVLLGYWVLASFSVKAVREKLKPAALWRFRIMQGFTFAMLAGVIPYRPLDLVLWRRSAAVDAIGMASCVAGLLVALWARWTLAGNWSASVTFKEKHELITNGPYRFVRHPIYTGLILMMLGTMLVMGRLDSVVGFVARMFAYYFKMRKEEAVMSRHFAGEYAEYTRRAGALVPWLGRSSAERGVRSAE